jgi:hypothetical protein
MTRALLVAAVALLAAPAANAQQILSQKRTVSAHAESFDPYDCFTDRDSEAASTTAAGAWNRTVEAFSEVLCSDYGTGGARQTTTIDTATASFSGDGATTAQTESYEGGLSIGRGKTTLEVTFRLDCDGGIQLDGELFADGWTDDPQDMELVTAVYTTLDIIDTATGESVFSRIATLADPIAILDDTVSLSAGTYKLVIVSFSEASTYPDPDHAHANDPNTYFNINAQIYQD